MAQKIETIQNNIAKIETWMNKKPKMVEKKITLVNKAGYAVGVANDEFFENDGGHVSNFIYDELKRAMANNENQKIIDSLYSLSVLTDDVQRKERELKRLKRIELEMLEALENLTPEQIERKEKREMEIALHNYIKNEMDNIQIPALESWLAMYKVAYIEMVEKYMDGWEKSEALRNTDKAVRNQKMNILIRSFPVVGKLEDIQFGTIGMNGEFNGTVRGERGIANIRTIMAGGYNIQCLHYRVLVN